ncbi:S-adenosyl methyltransferase [Actinomadura meyerae]|jgi:O-methyltransferase involved in polyketide biosynthesis|uniref:S-adenosyl methyltransferase n=1 Tax=Actinomadura meyerae TaxID=240840 RepID=A0A239MPJ6_9ACTN|nr:SAM-dependent methyltransferase [Actinomadura meyerae]SNT44163.1 S-adenosyl methyltransferase [Actinomadura meyerae]
MTGTLPSNEPSGDRPAIDSSVPHTARVWNYWLGGKDNYIVDRELGDQIQAVLPDIVASARADRGFLGRAVAHLAGEAGIRQFLDLGTGLPTAGNTHEVAQGIAPEARVVYVDNDPLVLTHAHALLTSTPEGATDYIEADVRDPESILERASATLDFSQPVAIMMLGILNFIPGEDEAQRVVDRLVAAVPSGSHLAIAHPSGEVDGEAAQQAVDMSNQAGVAQMRLRSKAELERFFTGLELLEPGVVSCSQWRPVLSGEAPPKPVYQFCGLGRKL